MLGRPAFTGKLVAKNLGVDASQVSRVTDFFYRELNAEIVKAEEPFIFVRGLGTFAMNLKPIEKMIKFYLKRRKDSRNLAGTEDKVREELFELFRMRGLIKRRLRENKKLGNATKTMDDSKR